MRRLYALGAHGVIACVLTSALAAALLIGRVALSGGPLFLFLGWNLILAWVPLLAVLPLAALRGPSLRDRLLALPFLGVWLAFLPNAPYLLTDVQHLAERAPVPLWCDAVLLGAFAVAGLTLTAASVYASWRAIAQVYTPFLAHASLVAVGPLVGLGMYLGRFLRWNSWDLVTRPGLVLADILERVVDPLAHPRTWAVTALGAAITWVAWACLASVRATPPSRELADDA